MIVMIWFNNKKYLFFTVNNPEEDITYPTTTNVKRDTTNSMKSDEAHVAVSLGLIRPETATNQARSSPSDEPKIPSQVITTTGTDEPKIPSLTTTTESVSSGTDEPKIPSQVFTYLSSKTVTAESPIYMPEITVDCTAEYSTCDQGKNLTDVPQNISADTQELDLSENRIKNITEKSFSHLQNLTSVSLKNSEVTNISPDSFVNHTQIISLQLGGNSMTSLPDGVFRNQSKLESLDLGDNPLEEIKAETLVGLKSMTDLRLSGSALKTMDPKTFTQAPSLTVLRLDITQITNFQTIIYNKDSYSKPEHPPKIVIEGSTILCHENMCWLKEKENEGFMTCFVSNGSRTTPKCANIPNVNWDEFQCPRPSKFSLLSGADSELLLGGGANP